MITYPERPPKRKQPDRKTNSRHLIECIYSNTNRTDNIQLEYYACVLWTFENGKIIEGRHFFSDQQEINNYFPALAT